MAGMVGGWFFRIVTDLVWRVCNHSGDRMASTSLLPDQTAHLKNSLSIQT